MGPASLEGLQVVIQDPGPPDSESLVSELYRRVREAAPRRRRSPHEPLQWGDQVVLDLVTLAAGQIIPGGMRRGVSWELQPFPQLPGLAEALVGQPSSLRDGFEVELPADYPVAWLANRTVVLDVEVREAWQVDMPALEDPSALEAAGLSPQLDEAMGKIAHDVDASRGEELVVEATNSVLDELCERLNPQVVPEEVLAEVEAVWQQGDGAFLSERGFSPAQLEQARRDVLEDPLAQADALRRLRIQKALLQVSEQEQLLPAQEQVQHLLQSAAESLGLPMATVSRQLSEDEGALRSLAWTAQHLRAVEYVMARAHIQIIEPD